MYDRVPLMSQTLCHRWVAGWGSHPSTKKGAGVEHQHAGQQDEREAECRAPRASRQVDERDECDGQGDRLEAHRERQQHRTGITAAGDEQQQRRQRHQRHDAVDLSPGGGEVEQEGVEEQEGPGASRLCRRRAEVLDRGGRQVGEADVGGDHRKLDRQVVEQQLVNERRRSLDRCRRAPAATAADTRCFAACRRGRGERRA